MTNELLEFLMEDSQFVDIMTPEFHSVNEGATSETYKVMMKANTKKIKSAWSDANRLYKEGKKSEALKKINECKDGYNNIKKDLNKIEDTFWGNVGGYLMHSGIFMLFLTTNISGSKGAIEWGTSYLIRLAANTILPGVGGVMGSSIKLAINKSKGIGTNNIVKSDAIAAIDENIKMCDKLIQVIKSNK